MVNSNIFGYRNINIIIIGMLRAKLRSICTRMVQSVGTTNVLSVCTNRVQEIGTTKVLSVRTAKVLWWQGMGGSELFPIKCFSVAFSPMYTDTFCRTFLTLSFRLLPGFSFVLYTSAELSSLDSTTQRLDSVRLVIESYCFWRLCKELRISWFWDTSAQRHWKLDVQACVEFYSSPEWCRTN